MKSDLIQDVLNKYNGRCIFHECNEDEDEIREGKFLIEFLKDEKSYCYIVTMESYHITNVIIELRKDKFTKTICNFHINFNNGRPPKFLKKIIEHSFSFF